MRPKVRDRSELRTVARNAQQATGQGHPMAIEAVIQTKIREAEVVSEQPFYIPIRSSTPLNLWFTP
jgi:hypothetical protein